MNKVFVCALGALLLVGCTPSPTAQTVPSMETYTNTDYGFSLQHPASIQAAQTFTGSYLVPDTWSVLDGNGTGQKVVEFLLPASNEITAAGLRIGASKDAAAVRACLQAPIDQGVGISTRSINGQLFTILKGSDAAMSHYRHVQSARIIREGVCLVFDEFVSGTNPDVYDTPRTAPFTKEEGFRQLDALLETLRFTAR